MSFSINFYTFEKKINSTARPTTPQLETQCQLKEPCGVLNPTIKLFLGTDGNPAAHNYAYIDTFKRYYFVTEWVYSAGVWEASLVVDVLASWKSEIGSNSCYILRSSAAQNGDILDVMYPAKSTTTISKSEIVHTPWATDNLSNGMFVVGIAGENTSYYMFTKTNLELFLAYLFSDSFANSLTDNWAIEFKSLKAQCNPMQYITSVMWYPFQMPGVVVDTIKVGWVDVPGVATLPPSTMAASMDYTHTFIKHPQSDRGSYLNNAPYSNYSLYYPGWGVIPINPNAVANSDSLYIAWVCDLRTGHATLTLASLSGSTSTSIMSSIQTQIGVSHQISQFMSKGYGFGEMILPAAATAAALASGNVAAAAVGAAAEIGNMAGANIPTASKLGSDGGIDSLRGSVTMNYEFKEIVSEDNAHKGRPLCETRQINTLQGYIKTSNAYIDIAATQTEKEKIISFMEGGFYYE